MTQARARRVRLDLAGGPVEVACAPGLDALADQLERLWSHLLGADDGPPREVVRVRSPDGPATGADEDALVVAGEGAAYAVSGAVTRAVLRGLLGRRLLLHAGALVRADVGTVVLVGASGAGKSTATARLARGGSYLSDELTILDPVSCALEAYPKPVSRVGSAGRVKHDVALGDLGLVPATGSGPPDHVVLLERGAGEASLVRRPLAAAIVELAGQSSSLWMLPDPLATCARLLERAGGALVARYADAHQLLDLLASPPAPVHETWEAVDPGGAGARDAAPGEVALAPFAQALWTERGTVVLGEGRVVLLDGLGEVAWHLLHEHGPQTRFDLERAVVAEIGAHPRSAELLGDALAGLADHGCVIAR